MVHKRTEANGYVIKTNRDQGYWTSYFVDNNGKIIASKPTKNQTEALQNQDDLSYIAVDLPPAKLGANPVVRAKTLDKAEEKVRKLADAARGSMASPQAKAAYRRALDELMQIRIDAGTQGTLFDVAPRQTTQRGLPGLFDNPLTADRERQYRIAEELEPLVFAALKELPNVGSRKRPRETWEYTNWGPDVKTASVPRWTEKQVNAQRLAIIKKVMRAAGVKGEDDIKVIGRSLESQTRPLALP